MKIKEFSQKYSVAIFYIAVILLIATIVLSLNVCSVGGKKIGPRDEMRINNNTMPNDIRQNQNGNNFGPGQKQNLDTNKTNTTGEVDQKVLDQEVAPTE